MYGSLHGLVVAQQESRLLLEVNQIGYWVHTGSWRPTGEITIFLHTHIREDLFDLYGFSDLETLAFFEQLIGVSGIGPKAALALLALGSPAQLRQAVEQEDLTFLSAASGVGKKAAQKIVLELKGKLSDFSDNSQPLQSANDDLYGTLERLGYKKAEIARLLLKLPPELSALDAQLKWALQNIGR